MKAYPAPTFTEAAIDQVATIAADYKARGWRFVQLCASTLEDSVELLYTYQSMDHDAGLEGVRVNVPDGMSVPSITASYPAAFVFENETHDLFGVMVDGINIDFNGEFYTVNVAYPMNPRAAAGAQTTTEEEASNE